MNSYVPDISEFMPPPGGNEDLLRSGDHFLISFPRSGRTWLATMIVATIVRAAGEMLDSLAEFEGLRKSILPEFDDQSTWSVTRFWRNNGRPPVIRSHTWNGVDAPGPSVYLLRRPEDCLSSYFRFAVINGFAEEGEAAFDAFVRGNLTWWILHIREALNRYENQRTSKESWLVVAYEMLHQDPATNLARILLHLGIASPDESIDFAVKLSSADFVRSSLPKNHPILVAKPGDGRERLSKELLDLLDAEATPLYERAAGIASC